MKKFYTLLCTVLFTVVMVAQAPQKMSYQAVIRNSSNALVASSPVGMRISILQGSESGTAVYVETQTSTTNTNGLATVEIGGGSVVSGTFAGIDWSAGPYFIKTETDPTGGTNYTITGTSQLLSVPYALHAKTAASYSETDPIFAAWDKSTEINITASQVSDFTTSVATAPVVVANTAKNSYPTADAAKLAAITGTNTGDETTATIKAKLGITTLSGSNTGDQTLSGLGGVASNALITGATKTKITYDTKGLVTSGADATTADIAASTDKNYVTDAQLTIIGNTSGTNSGDNADNTQYSGLVTNATHTGDAIGATALTVVGINGTSLAGLATGILKNTTGTGIPSIAVAGTDYLAPSSRYLGELYLGGVIFNLYKGSDGQEHGLIVSLTEQESTVWQSSSSLVNAIRTWDGSYNTSLMINSPAATFVTGLPGGPWYLPSIDELKILWQNRFYVNKALFDSGKTMMLFGDYWSSLEYNNLEACSLWFKNGQVYIGLKSLSGTVRGVKAF